MATYWPDNKCTRCGAKANGPLEQIVCEAGAPNYGCGETCCPVCGPPKEGLDGTRICKKCMQKLIEKAKRRGPPTPA